MFTKLILHSAIVICFAACNSQNKETNSTLIHEGGSSGMEITLANSNSGITTQEKDLISEQKLIKHGNISFETKSIRDTKIFLQKAILNYNGYISNEQIEDYRTNPTEILTVRIPHTDFNNLINAISQQVGEFDSKKIDIDDVSAEFVDIEARLKNKKQLEGKYQGLLLKANTMDDILKIEKEISLIREDIEATEGRLRYISNQVKYSTLTITYYEKKATVAFHFGNKLCDAFSHGGTGFLWFIIGLVQLWPLWLIAAVLWYIIYKISKYKKN